MENYTSILSFLDYLEIDSDSNDYKNVISIHSKYVEGQAFCISREQLNSDISINAISLFTIYATYFTPQSDIVIFNYNFSQLKLHYDSLLPIIELIDPEGIMMKHQNKRNIDLNNGSRIRLEVTTVTSLCGMSANTAFLMTDKTDDNFYEVFDHRFKIIFSI
jgi:hypothetical protein